MAVHDLSFDPRDPYLEVPGADPVRFAVQVFTTVNVYGLDPERITVAPAGDGIDVTCDGLRWGGQQFGADGQVSVRLATVDGVTTFAVHARHGTEPVKAVKLLLTGLPSAALAAGWWHPTMPDGERRVAGYQTPIRFAYPDGLDWQTPWACAEALGASVCVSVRDTRVRAKRFYAHTPPWANGDTIVEIVCEEAATDFDDTFTVPEVRLRVAAAPGAADQDYREHLAHISETFDLSAWEERPDVPAWARHVRLVANLHGQHWTGYVFNTFDRMGEHLRFLAGQMPGEQILAYVPGWEGRYYWQYPIFSPAEALGGPDGFARLAATARELGVHLMPMVGAHGANCQVYPEWEEAAFRNATDRYVVLFNKPDWDGDRSGEDDQVFLNTAAPGFRKFLVRQVDDLVSTYDLPAVYFDTTAAWFNDPRYDLYDGYRSLAAELHGRHPGLLLVGEGWYDALLGVFPLSLSWQGTTTRTRRPDLLARHGRVIQHILEGAPGAGSTGVYEGGFRPAERPLPTPGHLPSISFVDDTLPRYAAEVAAICRAVSR